MAYLFLIDTSNEKGFVALTENEAVLASIDLGAQTEYATQLHVAIQQLLARYPAAEIAGIGVVNGPGSYTGLRVGLSAAKGLCFAWRVPLMELSTLQCMAANMIANCPKEVKSPVFVPMIDARRMEVFMAVYDVDGNMLRPPSAQVLDEFVLGEFEDNHTLVLGGSGSSKWVEQFSKSKNDVQLVLESYKTEAGKFLAALYSAKKYASLPYCEPIYLKEFYSK